MKLYFKPLHDLAVASFKGDRSANAFTSALADEESKINSMYKKLLSQEEDYFVQKDEPSAQGKSLIYTWTRSSRPESTIQMTVWLCNDTEKVITALSHHDVKSADDMSRNAKPMSGIVYGSSEKYNPVLKFMENVNPY